MTEPQTQRRPRVLLLAYCCSPYHGSEEGLGWNVATQVARYCDTWVISEEQKFGPSIRRYLSENGPVPGLRFEFVPERGWAKRMWSSGLGYLSYNLWHRRALAAARRLHQQHDFDLAHQVNIIGFREPGYLWQLDTPFVWGPVGGTQNFPRRFLGEAGWRAGLSECVRGCVNRLQLNFSRRVRRAAGNAAAILAANSDNQRDLRALNGPEPILLPEVYARPDAAAASAPRSNDGVLRILWSGGFMPRKALSLLLRALQRMPADAPYRVRILGDGAEDQRWRRLAKDLGVDQHIEWMGWQPHEESVKQFRWADVFAFTSLRDTTGTVVLEALGSGVPVICLDHQGVGDVVNNSCGAKVAVTDPQTVAGDLCEQLLKLARDAELRERLRRGAFERAHDYLAENQGRKIVDVYRSVLASSAAKLDFSPRAENTDPAGMLAPA